MSSRLRKQSRLLFGYCDEYLSKAAFWKHHKAYYDVHRERWITKTDVEHLEHRAKRPKPFRIMSRAEKCGHRVLLAMRILRQLNLLKVCHTVILIKR